MKTDTFYMVNNASNGELMFIESKKDRLIPRLVRLAERSVSGTRYNVDYVETTSLSDVRKTPAFVVIA